MYQRLIKYEGSPTFESSDIFSFLFSTSASASPLPITRGRNSFVFLKISSRWGGTAFHDRCAWNARDVDEYR